MASRVGAIVGLLFTTWWQYWTQVLIPRMQRDERVPYDRLPDASQPSSNGPDVEGGSGGPVVSLCEEKESEQSQIGHDSVVFQKRALTRIMLVIVAVSFVSCGRHYLTTRYHLPNLNRSDQGTVHCAEDQLQNLYIPPLSLLPRVQNTRVLPV